MSINVAIHFLSCLPQFCLHSESDSVVDMRTGATIGRLDKGHKDEVTHLFISWPGMSPQQGISVGAAKYLEYQTSEAAKLGTDSGALDTALQAALIAISSKDR